jgi:hypothetical protein
MTFNRIGKEMTVVKLDVRQSFQCFEIDSLPIVASFRLIYYGGEVFGLNKLLLREQKVGNQSRQIKPVEPLPSLGSQAIIKVIPIDVSNNPFHHPPLIRDDPPGRWASGRRCYLRRG